ncbi:hypothetical protein MKR66_18290 [Acinetobacter baumannii]
MGKKVVSYKLDLNQKAATASEILRDVLGVPVTLPKWADDELQKSVRPLQSKILQQTVYLD